MKHNLTALLIVLVTLVARITLPFILPFILLTAKYVGKDTQQRKLYKLPEAFNWIVTPDEPLLPAGLYETQILNIYNKYGWYWSSYVWLGFRNVLHGFSYKFRKPAPTYYALMSDIQKQEYGISRKETPFLSIFKMITGYAVYKYPNKQEFYATPVFSVRFKWQD